MPQYQNTMEKKGRIVRFIAGKYAGKTGWIDKSRNEKGDIVPVIVEIKKDEEKATYVRKSSFNYPTLAPPSCYMEAILQQVPQIEKNLIAVCRQLVKCDVERDLEGFHAYVAKYIHDAIEWQKSKGGDAMYRRIKYKSPIMDTDKI